jgi:hypothetical protein
MNSALKFAKLFALAGTFAAFATVAHATPIAGTYSLNESAANGVTVSGHFNLNSSGNIVSYNFVVSEPSKTSTNLVFSGTTPNSTGQAGNGTIDQAYFNSTSGGNGQFVLSYKVSGTPSNGTVAYNSALDTLSVYSGSNIQSVSSFSSAAISVAPEPSSLVLLGSGLLGGAGLLLRKRRTLGSTTRSKLSASV